MNSKLKNFANSKSFKAFIFCLIIFLVGLSLMGLSMLSGGDPLDGLAGGRKTNSQSQDDLFQQGFFIALFGATASYISGLVLMIKWLIQPTSKK